MTKAELKEMIRECLREELKSRLTEDTSDDPFDYGPYKELSDPTLRKGDYIKAPHRNSRHGWYPGRVTSVSHDYVRYTISGYGFVENKTTVRPGSKAQTALSKLKTYYENN